MPTIPFGEAPYRNYTQGDINALKHQLNRNEIAVLHSIQKWDRFGKGQNGCYATVETIASDAFLTHGQVRNIISRLHGKGYVAFLGTQDDRRMRRRVTIAGYVGQKPKVVVYFDAGELVDRGIELNAPKHIKVKSVARLEVPTLEELRASRPSFLTQSETALSRSPRGVEMHREDRKEKEKDNPPSAGCSSSFSSEVPEDDCPEVVDEPEAEDIPEKKSHKKKDWKAMVEAQPFIDVLKKRFPGYSGIEARLLMNLVKHKEVSPAAIGHALENLHYMPREAEWNQPARPTNLAGFCRNFLQVQEVVIREVINMGQHDYEAEFQRFDEDPAMHLKMSMSHINSFKEKVTPLDWVNDEKYHSYYLWPDVMRFNVDYGIEGHLLVSLLSDPEKAELFAQLGFCAGGVKAYCERFKLDFKTVYGWTYEEVVAGAEKLKARWRAERDHHHKPACWTPNPWFRDQQAA